MVARFGVDQGVWGAVTVGGAAMWAILTAGRRAFPRTGVGFSGPGASQTHAVPRVLARSGVARRVTSFVASLLAALATAQIQRGFGVDTVGGAALVGLGVALAPVITSLVMARRLDTYVDATRRMSLIIVALVAASVLVFAVQRV